MYNNLHNAILPNLTRPGNNDQQSHPGHPHAFAFSVYSHILYIIILEILLFSILYHLRQLHLPL